VRAGSTKKSDASAPKSPQANVSARRDYARDLADRLPLTSILRINKATPPPPTSAAGAMRRERNSHGGHIFDPHARF